jgi:hypothetical protein
MRVLSWIPEKYLKALIKEEFLEGSYLVLKTLLQGLLMVLETCRKE